MDRLERYRQIARQIIADYASTKPVYGEIETEAVIDPQRDHYEVIRSGWQGPRRVHGAVIHFDIIDGKFWIQYDGTDRPVADELIAAGVPREHIVLAFHPAELRQHTGFAVG
jgi:hypothetical protein